MLRRVLVDGTTLTDACKEIQKIHDIAVSTCWGHWDEFRPAAHLNAARMFSKPPDLRSLLRIAEDWRRRAEAHKMSRSGWLLDASETWKVPEAVFNDSRMMRE
jgi:DNA-binding NtrC family response regulator